MDVLLQRIGRLHRHARGDRPEGYGEPRIVVLTPEERSLAPLIVRQRHGLGHNRDGEGVYADVRVLEATWRLLERHERLVIPAMNRALVEDATHPDALDAIVAELGWEREAQLRDGLAFAGRATARRDGLRFEEPIESMTFPSSEELVRTRLGLDDWILPLAAPARTPFGQTIASIKVPPGLARTADLGKDAQPTFVVAEPVEDGLSFPELGLLYTRIGLTVAT